MTLGVSAYAETPFASDPSNAIAYPSGINLSGQLGNEATQGNAIFSVTGNQASFVSGGAVAGASALFTVTGSQLTTSIGEETVNISVDITGIELSLTNKTFSQDTLTAFAEAPFATLSQSVVEVPSVEIEGTTGAGQLPSFLLQPAIGDSSILADAIVNVTGTGLSISTNNVSFEITGDIDVAGIPANFTLGPYSVSGNGNIGVIVTEHTINSSIGSAVASANADVLVTGSALSTLIGNSEAYPNDVVAVATGISSTYALGNTVIESKYSVDGIPLSGSINSVTIDASAVVVPTGIGLTQEVGPFNVIAWAEVDVGTPVIWTPVDLAA